MKSNWSLPPDVPRRVSDEMGKMGMSRAQAQLLYNRGISSRRDAEAFLNPSEADLHDPMTLPDMDLAAERLRKAVRDGEAVGVFGDFDMDGISGTAVATLGLRELGATVFPRLPDREEEGHGLNESAVRALAAFGASVLVTVDCGASDDAEIALARSLGVDCIITDHHTMFHAPSPDKLAMVNPKRLDSEYPYEDLTGAGLAYKLMQAVYAGAGREEPRHLLELAALGTVGDVGAMKGENRYFAREGLRRMNAGTSFAGLRALIEVAGLDDGRELDTDSLSFQIIPRLNAAGRMADPGVSLDLLTTSDPSRARELAKKLDGYNQDRRILTDEGVEQALAQIRNRWNGAPPPGVIMVGKKGWRPGVLGLIASKLVDTYGKPAIAVSVGLETSRASARSVEGFDIVSAIEARSDLLLHFGGHAQAAGFGARNENLRELFAHFAAVSDDAFADAAEATVALDMRASPSFVESNLYDFTRRMMPYGAGCPHPKFASSAPLAVVESRAVGAGGRHLKLRLREGKKFWDAIAFGLGARADEAPVGGEIEIAYSMEPNVWNGRVTMQLVTEDFRAV